MIDFLKIILPWLVAFGFGIIITPIITKALYKYKVWPKNKGDKCEIMNDDGKVDRLKIINKEDTKKTPRMGGIVIIFSVFFSIFFFWITSYLIHGDVSGKMDYLSRNQTWLPLVAFTTGAILGFIDDYLTVKSIKIGKHFGLPLKYRILVVLGLSFSASIWFFNNLNYIQNIHIPFIDHFYPIGIWIIPLFVLVFTSVFATSNIDGLDGLAAGIMVNIFAAMGVIAYFQDFINIAAFSFSISGAVLAFLWFNVQPARFYMGEVGYNALSFALGMIAFLTDTMLYLPIIAFPLFANLVVTVLQVFWIRVFKRRLFSIAPMHHIFEAKGWTTSKIVMRYWIISTISAVTGVVVVVLDKGLSL